MTEDIYGSMSEIINLFSAKRHEKIALYAHNPDSASDSFKKEAFLRTGGLLEDVFTNEGSLGACFEAFYEKHKRKRYGGIVCANDFAAISLIRHLKNIGEGVDGIDIISYSNTMIARCTSPAVSTVKANFTRFGQLAFMIVDCFAKGDGIRGISIFCDWEIIHRETSSSSSVPSNHLSSAPQRSGSFYGDVELMEMMRVETLLSFSDETDLEIIDMIVDGKKTSEIVDSCFLTETAVKYRIRKMKECCGKGSRTELRELLCKYISKP